MTKTKKADKMQKADETNKNQVRAFNWSGAKRN